MNSKKHIAFVCGFRALAAYAALSFFWLAFISAGVNQNTNTGISVFADRLLLNHLAIGGFSLVYGFSWFILQAQSLSAAQKRTLHILVNYIATLLCAYTLFSGASANSYVTPKTWVVAMIFATVIFFALYGLVMLGITLVKKKFK